MKSSHSVTIDTVAAAETPLASKAEGSRASSKTHASMGARGAAALAVLLALSAGADAHDNFKHRECKKVGNTEMQGSDDGPNVRRSPSLCLGMVLAPASTLLHR